ncbi:hypothetical protein GGQ73_000017 [Rhizobium skierniewicense]|uniref:DNA 3'-5' helicase n=2 Tax=Rhizobium skierniewicense TaxID=984260 RepID=A0A7W6C443_9HYPH|nr:hypothetical protein [Rhizobium skierniewicense]
MAILRAAYLGDPDLPGNGKVLLITYNKALSGYIRSISEKRLKNVTVEHYHLFARGYLNFRRLISYNDIIGNDARRNLIKDAVEQIEGTHKSNTFFDKTIGFFDSEVGWIAKNGISDLADYLDVKRIGRGDGLVSNFRKIIWQIRASYLKSRAEMGFRYDWDDISSSVLSALEADVTKRKYRHIVIDEGQDLSPQMLRSLAKAVPPEGSITFFGDVAQQIYGHRMSWRSAGLQPQKVWQFSENYRNSQQIAALGLAIAKMDYYAGTPDMVAPTTPKAAGPRPTLVSFKKTSDEMQFVASQAKAMAGTRATAILVRTAAQKRELKPYLPRNVIDLKDENATWIDGPNIYLGTYHSAKGLEFETVILPFMDKDRFPDPSQVEDFGQEEADANDGRLLYVGVTRAKTALIITHVGDRTHLLPPDASLYTVLAK